MIFETKGLPVYYEEIGEGMPVLFIHGWSVDHRLMSGCFEPVFDKLPGYRRIYPDLPGMGKTPSAEWIKNSDNALKLLMEFINAVIGNKNFLLAGESYGGYLTMGLIHELGSRIDGVLLLCPLVDSFESVNKPGYLPEKNIIWNSGLPDSAEDEDVKGFLDMAVIATPQIFSTYKKDVLSGVKIHDQVFLSGCYKGEYNPGMEKALRTARFDKPACIITGRQDHIVGYSAAYKILDRFPRAAFAVLDCAGHNLQIENEPVFSQLVKDWILRVEMEERRQ
ncbi:MAG: alpha/beta hydrolase [Treponema sp.]|nr:alpha/beta hydrolase [Treponema sp.]